MRASWLRSIRFPVAIRRVARARQSTWLLLLRSIRSKGNSMNESRRKFLTQSACGLSAAALLSAADRLGLINSLVQAQNAVATDYKALVCVFLSGGSDCNNMVVDLNQFSAYVAARGDCSTPGSTPNLGLTQSMLLP